MCAVEPWSHVSDCCVEIDAVLSDKVSESMFTPAAPGCGTSIIITRKHTDVDDSINKGRR